MKSYVLHTGEYHYTHLRNQAHQAAMSAVASHALGHDLIVRALRHQTEEILARLDREHERARAEIRALLPPAPPETS